MNLFRLSSATALLALASVSLAPSAAFADTIQVSYSAAGVQIPTVANNSYTTFGDTSASYTSSSAGYTTQFGTSGISGTYSGNFNIVSADKYGGAGGTGDYLQVVHGNAVTLTLSEQVNYFGLWFSALDAGNELSFYDGSQFLLSFTPADFIALVGACPGTTGFCGNPNDGYQDNNEQFAYLNFLDTNGTFNKVVFTETGNSADFEADNNAIVQAGTTTGTILGATPEPSGLVLLGTGLTALAGVIRRRRS